MDNFHLLCFSKCFGLKLIPVPPNHILLIGNIYNFLDLYCPNAPNSKKIKNKYQNSQFFKLKLSQ